MSQIRKIVRTISDALGFRNPELSILLTDDAQIHELNRTWRNKDRPTDVLSFPQLEKHEIDRRQSGLMLGDVVVSLDTAAAQAQRAGISLEAELRRLLVHGILHLLGHDHIHGGHQARKMRQEEERLLAVLESELGPA